MLARNVTSSVAKPEGTTHKSSGGYENLELWTGVGTSKKDPHGVRVVDKVLDMLASLTAAERAKVAARLAEIDAT